jgi:hypothetical protein
MLHTEQEKSLLTYSRIREYLDAVVPLKVIALHENGGPRREEFRQCAHLIDVLEQAVPMMLTDAQRNALAKSIAILSFVPCGIDLFGRHWEAGGDGMLKNE